jgi:hypothetical protein
MKYIYNENHASLHSSPEGSCIKKYLEQVDLLEYYITKNICKLIINRKDKKVIYNNLFLLAINNKNKKTSLEILLENQKYNEILELINYEYKILDFKNKNEINFLTKLLEHEFFYNKINTILDKIIKNDINFIIKIFTDLNINKQNFIDKIISIININENIFNDKNDKNDKNNKNDKLNINNLLEIINLIYLLEREDKFLLITKITREISNDNLLKYIFSYIKFTNIDIYPDENLLTCVDYLILNYNLEILYDIIDNINYIYFINIETNSIITLLEDFMDDKIDYLKISDLSKLIELIFKILEKSNILKIKNNKNQNIFFIILKLIKIDYKILSKYLKDQKIDIFEQDINGDDLFKIIKKKYNYNEIEYIFNNYYIKLNNKIGNYKKDNIITKLYKVNNLDLSKLLVKSDIGIFTADILHNVLYTIIFLQKYKNLEIPYFFQNNKYFNEQNQLIELSNNDKYIKSYLKLYFFNFNFILPHIIIWKNKNNYFFDSNLLKWINNNKNIDYIYIKLSIDLLNIQNTRHANLIIIDNRNKIVERFEPYGEINYYNSLDLNNFIINNISIPINYQFKFIQSFPGFQTRSNDVNVFNKTYGDPFGYCLAWCFLYLEIRLIINNKNDINPIDVINDYIINNFKKDNIITDNIYISFIRYYAVGLDRQKNILLKKYGINPSIVYHHNIDSVKYSSIINKLNNELINIIKNKN